MSSRYVLLLLISTITSSSTRSPSLLCYDHGRECILNCKGRSNQWECKNNRY